MTKLCQRRAAFPRASTRQKGTGQCQLQGGAAGDRSESPPVLPGLASRFSPQVRLGWIGRHPDPGHSQIARRQRNLRGALSAPGWAAPRFGFNQISAPKILNSPGLAPPGKGNRASQMESAFLPKQLPARPAFRTETQLGLNLGRAWVRG